MKTTVKNITGIALAICTITFIVLLELYYAINKENISYPLTTGIILGALINPIRKLWNDSWKSIE